MAATAFSKGLLSKEHEERTGLELRGANSAKFKLNVRPELKRRLLGGGVCMEVRVCQSVLGKNRTHTAGKMSTDRGSLEDQVMVNFNGETSISLGKMGHRGGRDGDQKEPAFTCPAEPGLCTLPQASCG